MPQDTRALNSPPSTSTSRNVPFRTTFYLGVCKDACIKTFLATVVVPVKVNKHTNNLETTAIPEDWLISRAVLKSMGSGFK